MRSEWPRYPSDVKDGDEPSFSPNKTQNSLLATQRGSDWTRRLETDIDNNLYVNIGAASAGTLIPSAVSPLAIGAANGTPVSTLTTIVTFTAAVASRLTQISVSGTDYAKFLLFKNTNLIDTRRTGPDRNLDFMFNSPLSLAVGDIIDVKVIHYVTGTLADFESTIYGA
jgi:hypothetical protein